MFGKSEDIHAMKRRVHHQLRLSNISNILQRYICHICDISQLLITHMFGKSQDIRAMPWGGKCIMR